MFFMFLTQTSDFQVKYIPVLNIKTSYSVKATQVSLNKETMSQVPPQLIHVSDSIPGLRRKRVKEVFVYLDEKEQEILDEELIERCDNLKIPPMWQKVWICPFPNGHLQATGYDAKKRKQYLYHPVWQVYSNQQKFNSLQGFAEKISKVRKQVNRSLQLKDWSKDKVVALAIALMDEGFLRVGNKQYETKNQTYGLTTLRRKHLEVCKDSLLLEYQAKSGKMRKIKVEDKRLMRLLIRSSELPGYELFRYKTTSGFESIDSSDINEWLHRITGNVISAKDFRTWGATVLALKLANQANQIVEENPRRKLEATLIKLIAKQLGNTMAVCRKYYVHPKVLEFSLRNVPLSPRLASDEENKNLLTPAEEKVRELLCE